ncbi:MAG TPA: glutathione S-transferase N-terminal domain-containing protein [Thermoleophilaceae bacterium]
MAAAKLYAIPGSHPSRTGELMLVHKGIDYERVNLPAGPHRLLVRLRGFPGWTVPAIALDGRKMQGTRSIARDLDLAVPEPRLLPADGSLRARVEEAERFGEQVLQPRARRIAAAAGTNDPDGLYARGREGRLGVLLARNDRQRRAIGRLVVLVFGATARVQREDRERIGGDLDRVDAWVAEGVLNGEQLNAADLQIATSLALLDYVVWLRPELQRRPLYALLDRVLPL